LWYFEIYIFRKQTSISWEAQGDSCQIGKIPSPEVNPEPPTFTQLVISGNSIMGQSHEVCSSIKKWHWRPAVVQRLLSQVWHPLPSWQ